MLVNFTLQIFSGTFLVTLVGGILQTSDSFILFRIIIYNCQKAL